MDHEGASPQVRQSNVAMVVRHGIFLRHIKLGHKGPKSGCLEVSMMQVHSALVHLLAVGSLTLRDEITPFRSSGRLTVYEGEEGAKSSSSGSMLSKACCVSVVGLVAKCFGRLFTMTPATRHCIGQSR